MKVYIIKWLLTEGIVEAEAEGVPNESGMISLPTRGGWGSVVFRAGDYVATEAEALEAIQQACVKKRISIRKQLEKLDAIEAEAKLGRAIKTSWLRAAGG